MRVRLVAAAQVRACLRGPPAALVGKMGEPGRALELKSVPFEYLILLFFVMMALKPLPVQAQV